MLARDKENFRTMGKNRTHDPLNTIPDFPTTEPEGRKFDSRSIFVQFFVLGKHGFSSFQVENVHWRCMCAAH